MHGGQLPELKYSSVLGMSPPPESPPTDAASGHVTRLLREWRSGSDEAQDELLELLYERLRTLARRARRGEGAGALETTALVNEAYLRLVGADVDWANTGHFLALASRAMRRVLVDAARHRNRAKRGDGLQVVTLAHGEERVADVERPEDFVRLDEAIDELLTLDERKGRAIELYYFGGLSYGEIAKLLEISEATTHRELRAARAWLRKELDAGADAG